MGFSGGGEVEVRVLGAPRGEEKDEKSGRKSRKKGNPRKKWTWRDKTGNAFKKGTKKTLFRKGASSRNSAQRRNGGLTTER